MQVTSILNKQTISTGIVATIISAGTFTIGLWDREKSLAVSETRVITSLENKVTAQQREIDTLSKHTDIAVRDLKTLLADIRKEFITDGTRNNKVEISLFKKRLEELNQKLKSLPVGLGGGINPKAIADAVQEAENRLTQRFTVQIGGLVDGAVSHAVNNKIAKIPTAGKTDIPIATVRRIHFSEEECVHLPSLGTRFSLAIKLKTEICIEPSQLFLTAYSADGYSMNFSKVASRQIKLIWGKINYLETKAGKYKIQYEQSKEIEGIKYWVWNFQKVS